MGAVKTVPASAAGRRDPRRGFTLVEAAVSTTILAVAVGGLLALFLQSRRLTEGSIYQNSAITIVQGYIEQMKNMEFTDLPYVSTSGTLVAGASSTTAAEVPTRLDESTPDTLLISNCAIPTLSSITSDTAPTGVTDNIKLIDINQTATTTDDLKMHIWVWIKDISGSSPDATQVRSITVIYTWRVNDGARSNVFKGTVRTIRSAVPTF